MASQKVVIDKVVGLSAVARVAVAAGDGAAVSH